MRILLNPRSLATITMLIVQVNIIVLTWLNLRTIALAYRVATLFLYH